MGRFLKSLISGCFYLIALAIPLLFTPFTSELFEIPKFLALSSLTIIICIFWILRCVSENKLLFRRTLLDKPLIIFLALLFVSWFMSLDRNLSWWGYYSRLNGGVLSWIIYSLLYWAAVSNLTSQSVRKLINCLLITGSIVSIWAIMESTGHSPSCIFVTGTFDVSCWKQSVQQRVFATLGQPNWLAAFLLPLVFIPLPRSLSYSKSEIIGFRIKGRGERVRWSKRLVVIPMLLALYLTHSRSGLLALAVGTIIYKKLYWLLFPVLIVTTIYVSTLSRSIPISSNQGTESVAIRIQNVWPGAIRSWLFSPKTFLIGWGPETFAQVYPRFRPTSHNLTSEWQETYNKAHNEYLHFLSTTGLLGLAAYLYLLYSIFKLFTKHPSLLASFSTLLVTNFWGFSVTSTNMLLFLLPVLGASLNDETIPYKSLGKLRYLFLLLIIPCILTLFSFSTRLTADLFLALSRKNYSLFEQTQKPEYLLPTYNNIHLAYQLNPQEPVILSELAYTAAFIAASLHKSDPSLSADFLNSSLSAGTHSLQLSANNPQTYRTLTRTYMLLGNIDEKYLSDAIATLKQASVLAPTDPRIFAQLYLLTKDENYKNHLLQLKPNYQFE